MSDAAMTSRTLARAAIKKLTATCAPKMLHAGMDDA
jgi:hypothetical protein